jgi:thiol:disulfide interchange protein DsbA
MDYGIDGVPMLAIDGRYLVIGHDHAELLNNADQLIAKVRAERAAAKPAPKGK